MNKFILFVSILTLFFAVISCENVMVQRKKVEDRLLDSLKQDSINKLNTSTKEVVESKNIYSKYYSYGPISFSDNSEGYPALFLNAFNKALKWGKLNKTIKVSITKHIMSLTKIIVDELRFGSDGMPINVDFSFVGSTDGTWEIMITPDKVEKDGIYYKSSLRDAEYIKEQEVIEAIPKLKELVILAKKQDAKEKLFH